MFFFRSQGMDITLYQDGRLLHTIHENLLKKQVVLMWACHQYAKLKLKYIYKLIFSLFSLLLLLPLLRVIRCTRGKGLQKTIKYKILKRPPLLLLLLLLLLLRVIGGSRGRSLQNPMLLSCFKAEKYNY